MLIALLASAALFAQTKPAASPSFEVASVKPNTSTGQLGSPPAFLPGGKFTVRNIPVFMIVATAYNIPFQSDRLTGAPDWTRTERYDIEATAADKNASAASMRLMLQSLLAERFQLKIRREFKDQPVYAIVVSKKGPKLEKSKLDEKDCSECHIFLGGQGRGMHGQGVDMSDLALYVSNWTDHPTIDKTGLKGLFHIETKPWLPMRLGPQPPAGAKAEDGSEYADLPTIFTVFDQLGLKLEPQRAKLEMFAIKHLERPSGN